MNNVEILQLVRRIKNDSVAYQKAMEYDYLSNEGELGGHIGYFKKEEEDTICPDDDFVTSLFEECSAGLGFTYEKR